MSTTVVQQIHREERIAHILTAFVALTLFAFLVLPLLSILLKALEDKTGQWVGLNNFIAYARTPALLNSLWNSVWVSALVTFITVPLAFAFAYALSRSCMPVKSLFRGITLVPLLAPSLLSAISLIYWFGNQGLLKRWLNLLGIDNIYGAPGIVTAECFAMFPHVMMILVTALSLADARLYEAADAMGTSTTRKFFTITLPGAKYGLISAALVCFTSVITDFGIPKVIGGNFNVLATDIFKLVIGQQEFSKGSVVAILLLLPALLTFAVDAYVRRKQTAMLTARAVPFAPNPHTRFDVLMTAYCAFIALLILAVLGMAIFASVVKFWPYDLTLTLQHYAIGLADGEASGGFLNSIKMATGTAFFGSILVFCGAYLIEKTQGFKIFTNTVRLAVMLPMAVPGLVLGLGYIFFFNAPSNPLNSLYHTTTLLTICTIIHFYTTGHLTAVTALKGLDKEFESVSASLKVPFYKTFWRVTLPICSPALIDIARYFFINAMTTISAVVFLYSPETKVASISILNLDESGEVGAAAAMAILIGIVSTIATLCFLGLSWTVNKRTQAWRNKH
jgi:iron(III) transport system permease protein